MVKITSPLPPQEQHALTITAPQYFGRTTAGEEENHWCVLTNSHYQILHYGKKLANFITWVTTNGRTSQLDRGKKALTYFCPKRFSTCFRVLPTPSKEAIGSISFLAWVSLDETSSYFSSMHKKLQEQKEEDMQRKTWKQHFLYQESKETLAKMCSESRLLATGKKHDLVQHIVKNHM